MHGQQDGRVLTWVRRPAEGVEDGERHGVLNPFGAQHWAHQVEEPGRVVVRADVHGLEAPTRLVLGATGFRPRG